MGLIRKEFQYFFWAVGLGVVLVAYAHATFSTKDSVNTLHEDVRIIQGDVKEILKSFR